MAEAEKIRATLRAALGDGERSPDFQSFVEFASGVRATYAGEVDPKTVQLVRFMELFSIAAVEGGREATAALGPGAEATADVMHLMCTGASIAVCSAILSVLKDDTPASALRAIVLGSFREGLAEVIRVNGLK